jgi:hypothetical protein
MPRNDPSRRRGWFFLQLLRLGLFLVLVHSLIAVFFGIGMAIAASWGYAVILIVPGLLIAWPTARGLQATDKAIQRR